MGAAGAPGRSGDPLPQTELTAAARSRLEPVIALLASDATAPSAVIDPERAWTVHVADSLSGLGFPALAAADRIADVGAGAGFPGLVLAAMLSDAEVDLVESIARKCEFIDRAVTAAGLDNARAINARAEDWARPGSPGREAYDAVTARAVGRLSTIAELASPLLADGGVVVAWKGRRDPDEEAELERGHPRLGIEPEAIRRADPYAGSRNRHLHLMRKSGPTPPDLPRRAGMAKKRPRGSH
ncbi:MAG TPA: 16S rRNA (guanine(527)-N(7))-methyltransferase RsmG [Solirubrobacterales bacterium]|nr:16S rRNA (guanine(527)-N(7))-methyltransferase RsmG [Solirubrobacterales bacterium]